MIFELTEDFLTTVIDVAILLGCLDSRMLAFLGYVRYPSIGHMHGAMGIRGTGGTVGDHDDSHTVLIEPLKQGHYRLGVFGVQISRGLIGQ
jgi:hypothetical protein